MSALADALASTRAENLRRAARSVLRTPLLRADDERFLLVRRYGAELREWFDRNTGWQLHVDSEVARLVKRPATTGCGTYPARDIKSKRPFSRRRYVLTCLALAVLERADQQISLGRMAEHVVLGAADPQLVQAGVTFSLEGREERADLVAVVRLLLELGVLRRVAGEEEAFVKEAGDVLYDVQRRVLSTLLATPRGPSTVADAGFAAQLGALTAELPPTTDDLRNQRIRHRLTRQLLDEPVLYYSELTEQEHAYLNGQRAAIIARINELTGLVAEVRFEGIAMVDPQDELTDIRMPETGTEGHATLLLAEYLAGDRQRVHPLAELHAHIRQQAAEHRSYWRRNATDPGMEVELTAVAVDRLEALGLIARRDEGVTALPALARYAMTEPTIREPS